MLSSAQALQEYEKVISWVETLTILAARDDNATHDRRTASSTSKLTGMLRQQLEQSGFLQQLPQLFEHVNQLMNAEPAMVTLAAATATEQYMVPAASVLAPKLMDMLHSVSQLYSSFYTTHTVGQQCLVPVMQLQQQSMRYISTALHDGGLQRWIAEWMGAMTETGKYFASLSTLSNAVGR